MPDSHWFADIQEFLDELNCGFLATDEQRTIRAVNHRLLDWLGYAVEELVGQQSTELVPVELRELLQAEADALDAGDLRARLTVLRRKDSTTFPVVILPKRMHDGDGNFVATVLILVELGAVQTAKNAGYHQGSEVRATLEKIALELQTISILAGSETAPPLPLAHPDLGHLSPREKDVLVALVGGERVPSIAERLHVSPHTVRTHLKHLFRKMGVESQAELIDRIRTLGS